MDPITTAIVAGIANTSKDAIKDCYGCLKTSLKKKFGSESDLIDAIDKLEKKPDSQARKASLQEEIEIAKVNDCLEIVSLAEDLRHKLQEQSQGEPILNQTQTNKVSNIKGNISGNFTFSPVQKGSSQ